MTDAHIHIERGPYAKEWINKFVKKALETDIAIPCFTNNIGVENRERFNAFSTNDIVNVKRNCTIDEIYLLEHSHRFEEFSPMYASICEYSEYQKNWYGRKKKLPLKQYKDFINEMRLCVFPLKIKWGLEVCYFPEHERLISNILNSFDFDFTVGSVHWVDGFGFDHKAEFWQGVNIETLYKRYYELTLQLVKSGLFNGLSHPDSIKCFNHFPETDLTETYHTLAKELNRRNMYVEQNGGLALNYGFKEKGMNKAMLRTFTENGADIRFASDAHRPEDVGANIVEMRSYTNLK